MHRLDSPHPGRRRARIGVLLAILGAAAFSSTTVAGEFAGYAFDSVYTALFQSRLADLLPPYDALRTLAEKGLHVVLFALLGFSATYLRPARLGSGLLLVSLLAFAACTELAQLYAPGRTPAIRDAVLNGLSVTAGLALGLGLRRGR